MFGIHALNLQEIIIQPVQSEEQERFQSLMKAHHYLGALPKIGHTLWYVASYHNEWLGINQLLRRRVEICGARSVDRLELSGSI